MNTRPRGGGYGATMVILLTGLAGSGCGTRQQDAESTYNHENTAQLYQVEAIVTGLRNRTGSILSVLCKKDEAFPNQCELRTRVDLEGDPVILKYTASRGEYALAAFHDEDGNGQINITPSGIPSEGVAFSNDTMSPTGPPTFEMARFKVDTDVRITTKMLYFQ